MLETTKGNLRRVKEGIFVDKIFCGKGIDIGAGKDSLNKDSIYPNITSCDSFDVGDGDAQFINRYKSENSYDFVYSSHCLEHLDNPYVGLQNWFSLIKPRGYLVLSVPDEDLYEQGHWPSKFSDYHLWSFTVQKWDSWCPKSINVVDLVQILPDAEVISIKLVDTNYHYDLKNIDQTFHFPNVECSIEAIIRKISR